MRKLIRMLELTLRHGVVYPLLRLVFRNPPHAGTIDLQSVNRLLILRYDRLGDIVVTTPVFRLLKKQHPGLFLGVLASQSNAELIRTNPFVDRIHVLPARWRDFPKFLRDARRERYDVVLNFIFNRTTSGGVLANLIAPDGLKVGQGAEKYGFYFNKLLTLDRSSSHMRDVLMSYVKSVFGLKMARSEEPLEIIPNSDAEKEVSSFLKEHGLKQGSFVVVNISAAEEARCPSTEQMAGIVRVLTEELKERCVVISAPGDVGRRSLVAQGGGEGAYQFPRNGSAGMLSIAALLQRAKAVITPDTSIVHLSSAAGTPVLALYTPLRVTHEWLPFRVRHAIILADAGKGVSSIPAERLRQEVTAFLKPGRKKKGQRQVKKR